MSAIDITQTSQDSFSKFSIFSVILGTCAAPEAKLDDDEEITEEELESQEQARRFAAEGNLGTVYGTSSVTVIVTGTVHTHQQG